MCYVSPSDCRRPYSVGSFSDNDSQVDRKKAAAVVCRIWRSDYMHGICEMTAFADFGSSWLAALCDGRPLWYRVLSLSLYPALGLPVSEFAEVDSSRHRSKVSASQGGSDRSSYWLSDIGRQRQPGGGVSVSSDDSLRLYTAAFLVFQVQSWLRGFFWWRY